MICGTCWQCAEDVSRPFADNITHFSSDELTCNRCSYQTFCFEALEMHQLGHDKAPVHLSDPIWKELEQQPGDDELKHLVTCQTCDRHFSEDIEDMREYF